ncbi:flagellar motor protein [Allohahella marinimesophila]|uniref:Flagellar motor protein n=1 Tax=Allohahella marinimesophila TaxID=1054972 RepID=A0ABP7NJ06_9GAMM
MHSRTDVLSIVGIIIALVAVIGGNYIEGGHLAALVNAPAALIVIGGTLGAIVIQHSGKVLKNACRQLVWIIRPPKPDFTVGIEQVVGWSNIARKEGLLGLEGIAESEPDPFSRKGLQLLVDGAEPEVIRSVLELELDNFEKVDLDAARVYDAMGGYAPTLGILGAVLGLVHVMQNLADPSKLGPGIATAFVATIYGVALANLLFFPVASKLKSLVHSKTQYREMLLEGVVAIAEGENPRAIEMKLQSYESA